MYIPEAFREDRLDVLHGLMRAHPLAMFITGGPGGLAASQIPFLVDAAGERGTLRAHLARANPHGQELAGGAPCLVVFQGEQGYVTPSWYPSKAGTGAVVPTWNYATVHAWGQARLVEDAAWLLRLLEDLTRSQEQKRDRPWAVADAPADYIATMMKDVVGIEIPIARIEGKWKLSQNRQDPDRAGVIAGMRAEGDAHRHPALADLVAERFRPPEEAP
jgi:transcriptional regulator